MVELDPWTLEGEGSFSYLRYLHTSLSMSSFTMGDGRDTNICLGIIKLASSVEMLTDKADIIQKMWSDHLTFTALF